MEGIVDLPVARQGKAIGDRSKNFFDRERSFSFGCDLLVIHGFEVLILEPDFLSLDKGLEVGLNTVEHPLSGDLVCCEGFSADPTKKLEPFI